MTNLRTDEAARANGLIFDAAGLLLACEGGLGRIARTEADGSRCPNPLHHRRHIRLRHRPKNPGPQTAIQDSSWGRIKNPH